MADPFDATRDAEGEREEDLDSFLIVFPAGEDEMGVNGTGADDDNDPEPELEPA